MKKIIYLTVFLTLILSSCGEITTSNSFSNSNSNTSTQNTTNTTTTNSNLTTTTTSSGELNDYNLANNIQDGVILHCFNWNLNNIKNNIKNIAEAGFSAIQTSPMQQQKDYSKNNNWKNEWWKLYQPLSFSIAKDNNSLGNKSDLIELCKEADKYGIKVIVDVVSNHLSGGGSESLNSDVLKYEPEIYKQNLIHKGVGGVDDSSVYKVTKGYLGGYPDLQTESSVVQNRVISLLKEYVDCGVDGFRFDAAKHIETMDDGIYSSNFWSNVLTTTSNYAKDTYNIDNIYYYGEILNTPGVNRRYESYTSFMSVTDNKFGNNIREAVVNKNLTNASNNRINAGSDKTKVVLWAESHDTYSNDSKESTNVSIKDINKTYAIVASKSDATSLYFARPNNSTIMGEIGDKSYLNKEVIEINKFHNNFIGSFEEVYTSNNSVITKRSNKNNNLGYSIVNLSDELSANNIELTGLKDGTYKDQISGNSITINNSKITNGLFDESGIMVIYENETSKPSDEITIINSNNDNYLTPSSKINISVNNATSMTYSINSNKISFNNSINLSFNEDKYNDNEEINIVVEAKNENKSIKETYTYKFFNADQNNIYFLDLENNYHLANENSAFWIWQEGSSGYWFTNFIKQDYFIKAQIPNSIYGIVYVQFNSANFDWSNKTWQTSDIINNSIIYELKNYI